MVQWWLSHARISGQSVAGCSSAMGCGSPAASIVGRVALTVMGAVGGRVACPGIGGLDRRPEECVRLLRLACRLLGARAVAARGLVDRVRAPVLAARVDSCADGNDDERPAAGADDRVRCVRGTVDEVPRPQRPSPQRLTSRSTARLYAASSAAVSTLRRVRPNVAVRYVLPLWRPGLRIGREPEPLGVLAPPTLDVLCCEETWLCSGRRPRRARCRVGDGPAEYPLTLPPRGDRPPPRQQSWSLTTAAAVLEMTAFSEQVGDGTPVSEQTPCIGGERQAALRLKHPGGSPRSATSSGEDASPSPSA
jgi:hypothetical protein